MIGTIADSYNHTGTQLFDIKPHSSMITLMETAKVTFEACKIA